MKQWKIIENLQYITEYKVNTMYMYITSLVVHIKYMQ